MIESFDLQAIQRHFLQPVGMWSAPVPLFHGLATRMQKGRRSVDKCRLDAIISIFSSTATEFDVCILCPFMSICLLSGFTHQLRGLMVVEEVIISTELYMALKNFSSV